MTEESSLLDPFVISLGNRVGALALAIQDEVNKQLGEGATVQGSDASALVLLSQNQALGIDSLAKQLMLAHSSTVRLVERLVKSGLVKKDSGRDKRSVDVSLTSKGESVCKDILNIRQACLSRMVSGLDIAHTEIFLKCIDSILHNLTGSNLRGEQICRMCDEVACDLADCPVEKRCVDYIKGVSD